MAHARVEVGNPWDGDSLAISECSGLFLDEQHSRRPRELALRARQSGRDLPLAAVKSDLNLMETGKDRQRRFPPTIAD